MNHRLALYNYRVKKEFKGIMYLKKAIFNGQVTNNCFKSLIDGADTQAHDSLSADKKTARISVYYREIISEVMYNFTVDKETVGD